MFSHKISVKHISIIFRISLHKTLKRQGNNNAIVNTMVLTVSKRRFAFSAQE